MHRYFPQDISPLADGIPHSSFAADMELTTGNRAVSHDRWAEHVKMSVKNGPSLPGGGYGARLPSLEVGKCISKSRYSFNDVLHKTIVESNNRLHKSEKGGGYR